MAPGPWGLGGESLGVWGVLGVLGGCPCFFFFSLVRGKGRLVSQVIGYRGVQSGFPRSLVQSPGCPVTGPQAQSVLTKGSGWLPASFEVLGCGVDWFDG